MVAGAAGVPAEGSGFRGVTLSYVVKADERVAQVLAEAERAGGKILKPAAKPQWGGMQGTFSDPDGHIWNVAAGGPFAAE
jgi:uncharacterized glyoxalase superfamily protein PhnB